jgi:hypothetical protein
VGPVAALVGGGCNGIFQFYEPRALPIDVLSLSFGALSGFLYFHDGLLLLSKPLYFFLDPDQLTIVGLDFLFFCFVLILDFDLVELSFALVDLRRWWRWVGVEVLVASVALAGICCGGGHVGLLQLNFWDLVEGWMLCSFGDGGEGLSGWLLEWGWFWLEFWGKPSSGCRRWLTLLGGIIRVVFGLRTRWWPNVGIK